jgi:hypothetical protein
MTSSKEQQIPVPTTPTDVVGPIPGTVMIPEYASVIARIAYLWGWPLVNMHNRREMFGKLPSIAYIGGAPMAPPNQLAMYTDYVDPLQRQVAHPNQDVVYGFGIFSPGQGPIVVQVPDFGDRFWVYALYDQRTDAFAMIGKQYGTEPGFYLVVGPDWEGKAPEGISGVITLATSMGIIVPRVFMDDTAEDRAAIQPLINQISMYPLSEFDGEMKTVEWKNIPSLPSPASSGGEMKWVQPQAYFDQLGGVLDEVPPLPGEESLYAQFRALLAAAADDPAVKAAITQTAEETEKDVVSPLFYLKNVGVLLPGNWTRGLNGAGFGTDYLTRLAMAKSNIFVNRNQETVYFYQYKDGEGDRLNGSNRYALTFKKGALPPVQGFWSLTMYNREHFFNVNDQERYSLGTKNKTLQYADDGSLTIYVQHDKPTEDRVSNWLPAPDGDFAMTIRCYWPDDVLANGDWLPPVVEKVK